MKNISAAKWKQVKGQVREKWGKLTENEIDVINGRIDQLVGKLEEKYAIKKEEVEKDVRAWYEQHFAGKNSKNHGPSRKSLLKKLQEL
ncbi:MAG: CsbD family protein [Dehalococcoidia bacterium]|nr:CsbD family protein [Dehalococcoidia bacterium]